MFILTYKFINNYYKMVCTVKNHQMTDNLCNIFLIFLSKKKTFF